MTIVKLGLNKKPGIYKKLDSTSSINILAHSSGERSAKNGNCGGG